MKRLKNEIQTYILLLRASIGRPKCGTGEQSKKTAKHHCCRTVLEKNIISAKRRNKKVISLISPNSSLTQTREEKLTGNLRSHSSTETEKHRKRVLSQTVSGENPGDDTFRGKKQSRQAKTHPAAPLWFVPSLKPPHRVSREVIQLQLQRLKVSPTAVLQVALMGAFVACCLRAAAGQRRERGGLVNREEGLLTPPSGRGAEEETWQEGGAQAATKARTTAGSTEVS